MVRGTVVGVTAATTPIVSVGRGQVLPVAELIAALSRVIPSKLRMCGVPGVQSSEFFTGELNMVVAEIDKVASERGDLRRVSEAVFRDGLPEGTRGPETPIDG